MIFILHLKHIFLSVTKKDKEIFWAGFMCFILLGGCSIESLYVNEKRIAPTVETIADTEILQSLFLIGDAGNPTSHPQERALTALQKDASKSPAKNMILFLGDNIYPLGMPEQSAPDRKEMERRLDEQIRVVTESGACGIFILGNHDWMNGKQYGLDRLGWEEAYITGRKNSLVQFFPQGGCPGPEVVDVDDNIRLVILDTQWWLHTYSKPIDPFSQCVCDSKDEIISALEKAIQSRGNRFVIIAAHHPLETHGPHGGFFDWSHHIFPLRKIQSWMWIPLPGIGLLYPLARNLGISNQDQSSARYGEMIRSIEAVLEKNPPTAFTSGHEHCLQIMRWQYPYYNIVSGGGLASHDVPLTTGDNTLFADRHDGFMRIDVLHDRRVRLGVIEPIGNDGKHKEVFSMWLVR